MRRARRLQLEFEFLYVKFCVKYFLLQMKICTLKIIGYLNCHLFKYGIRVGHNWLLSPAHIVTHQADDM